MRRYVITFVCLVSCWRSVASAQEQKDVAPFRLPEAKPPFRLRSEGRCRGPGSCSEGSRSGSGSCPEGSRPGSGSDPEAGPGSGPHSEGHSRLRLQKGARPRPGAVARSEGCRAVKTARSGGLFAGRYARIGIRWTTWWLSVARMLDKIDPRSVLSGGFFRHFAFGRSHGRLPPHQPAVFTRMLPCRPPRFRSFC